MREPLGALEPALPEADPSVLAGGAGTVVNTAPVVAETEAAPAVEAEVAESTEDSTEEAPEAAAEPAAVAEVTDAEITEG